ncbi:MAG: protein serine/threonine phosphatase [Bacteroidetes bacterium]|nr:MAG: protein serine/threonine phosphatase [Bacteroidota bacterium]
MTSPGGSTIPANFIGSVQDEKRVDEIIREANKVYANDYRQAFRMAGEANLLAQVLAYRKGIAESELLLARCYLRLSDYPKVLETALSAIDHFHATGNKKGEADALNTLGWVYNYLGDHESRLKSNLRCLELRRETCDAIGETGTMNNLGDTCAKLGRYAEALDYFRDCLAHPQLSERSRSIVLHNIGEVHFYKGEYDRASIYFLDGLELARKLGYHEIVSIANIFLAEVLIDLGKIEDALKHLQEAHTFAQSNDLKDDLFRIHKNYAVIYEHQGKTDLALKHYKIYHETKDELYNETNIQQIKNIQFQYEAGLLRKETELERDRNEQLQQAYEQINFQKNEITGSIRYAKRLQEAFLPPVSLFEKFLPDSFILYRPKDIVSGDFYWLERWGDKILLAAVDCTGHGVPGAFMSIVGHSLLNSAVNELGLSKPSLILNALNKGLSKMLNRTTAAESDVKDGMDVTLAAIDLKRMTAEVAGAQNPLYLVRNNTLTVIQADRFSIGAETGSAERVFKNHEFALEKGDCLYLFTDGYADQFGGPKGKKLKYKQVQELLLHISGKPMREQGKILEKNFDDWRGSLEQVDDVLILGFRIV